MPQMKEQEKTPENKAELLSEMEISNLPNKNFKETVTRMFNKLENRMEELREHFNKERENVIKNKSEM